jgi:carnitine monooxygenase subunit
MPEATPGLNRRNLKNALFDANVIFPNFGVHALPNGYLAFRYWPDDYNRTNYEFNHYFSAPTNYAEALNTAYQRSFINAITEQDLSTLERTQTALESGCLKELQVGDEEILIRHSHKMVTDAVTEYAKAGS